MPTNDADHSPIIRTPDQRLRVFISSTLQELADEREAAREAIEALRLNPVLFELGARPHPAQALYRAYLAQSHIFVGIYWERYGWVAPDMDMSGLEDEYHLAGSIPKLIYIKRPAPDREPGLAKLLRTIKSDSDVSYKYFSSSTELRELVANDLALLLTERFEQGQRALQSPETDTDATTGVPPGRRIPQLPTPLLGRQQVLLELRDLLMTDDVRLVTVTGPGGVGKTSLALQIARDLAAELSGGVYWVPLATIQDASLVLSAIAQALDVRERAGTTLLESVKGFLRERAALLLLDNFEQVLSAADLLGDLLTASRKPKFLITSRAPLRVRGEREFPLPPLSIPDPPGMVSQEEAMASPAVALFVERAQAVHPAFSLDASNAADISNIVRRLDGLPLAIELAAARSKLLSPRAILERMGSRLDLLTGGARDLPARQQTLRNTIDWSYELLPDEHRVLFHRLAIFTGGFTLEAAEEGCAGREIGEFVDGVQALLDNSLLRREAGAGKTQRFVMLQTIREYALERLVASGEGEDMARKHAATYAKLVTSAWEQMFSGASDTWLDLLELDYGNLRAAMDWHYSSAKDRDIGRQMIVYLVWFWYRRGYLNEARVRYQRAMAQAPAGVTEVPGALLRGHAGAVAMWQSDLETAKRLMDESIAQLESLGALAELGDVLFTRGVLAVNQGDDRTATEVLHRARELMQSLNQQWFVAMIVLHLGNVALARGHVEQARLKIEEALAIGQQVGDQWIVASAINNLGEIARYTGDVGTAWVHYHESLALFRSVASTPDVARAYHSLALIAVQRAEHQEAARLLERSVALYQQVGVKRGIVECLNAIASLAAATGQTDVARSLAATARAEFSKLGAGIWPADERDVKRFLERATMETTTDDSRILTVPAAVAQGQQFLAGITAG